MVYGSSPHDVPLATKGRRGGDLPDTQNEWTTYFALSHCPKLLEGRAFDVSIQQRDVSAVMVDRRPAVIEGYRTSSMLSGMLSPSKSSVERTRV